MKVCLISGEYPPMRGGVADYTSIIARSLGDIDVETFIITSVKAENPEDVAVSPVYPIVKKWGFFSLNRIIGILRNTAADIANIQYQTAAYSMHPAINLLPFWLRYRLKGCLVITTFHDLREPYLFPKAGSLRLLTTKALVKGSHAVIATNNEDFETLLTEMNHGYYSSGRLRLIPIGSNVAFRLPNDFNRDQWRAKLGLEPNDIAIGYFGLLNSSKGVDTLVNMLHYLINKGTRAKLVMIGAGVGASDPTNVWYQEKILRQISDLGLDQRVIWTGYTAQGVASAHFRAIDVCILPYVDGASYRRGTLMAALAHGVPIVTTKVELDRRRADRVDAKERLPELVDGENCLLVPPRNEEVLVQAVYSLMRSSDLRAKIARGASTLAEEFSWDSIADKLKRLYCELLANRDRNP